MKIKAEVKITDTQQVEVEVKDEATRQQILEAVIEKAKQGHDDAVRVSVNKMQRSEV